MPRAEAVKLRLRPLGESGQTAALPQRVHPISPPGEDLVGVNLLTSQDTRTTRSKTDKRMLNTNIYTENVHVYIRLVHAEIKWGALRRTHGWFCAKSRAKLRCTCIICHVGCFARPKDETETGTPEKTYMTRCNQTCEKRLKVKALTRKNRVGDRTQPALPVCRAQSSLYICIAQELK